MSIAFDIENFFQKHREILIQTCIINPLYIESKFSVLSRTPRTLEIQFLITLGNLKLSRIGTPLLLELVSYP